MPLARVRLEAPRIVAMAEAAPVAAPARPEGVTSFGKASYLRAAADSAELVLYDDIGNSPFGGIGSKDVMRALDQCQGCSDLHVRLNSIGGDVFEGLAIYNALSRFPAKKTVHVDALAASIASVIAMAGDKVVMAPNSAFMIHEARGSFSGTEDDAGQMKDRLAMANKTMAEIYAKATGNSIDDCRSWMKATTWMDADTAKARGFSDETEGEGDAGARVVLQASALDRLTDIPRPIRARLDRLCASAALPPTPAPSATVTEEFRMEKLIALLAGLGIKASTEGEIVAAIAKLREDAGTSVSAQAKLQGELSALLSATGKQTVGEAVGVIDGLKAEAAKVVVLNTKLAAVEKATTDAKAEALIKAATEDGRLAPAKLPDAKKLYADHGLPALEASISMMSPAVKTVETGAKAGETAPAIQATDEQKKIAASLGVPLEKVLAMAAASQVKA